MLSSKVKSIKIIKVEIAAGSASITPPLGPVLGQYGMNTMEFCKEFNEETKNIEKDTILPVIIYLSLDKSFYFVIKAPGVAYLLRKFVESDEYIKQDEFFILDRVIFLRYVYDIALFKICLFSLNISPVIISKRFFKNYINSIIGTARSFNIRVQ